MFAAVNAFQRLFCIALSVYTLILLVKVVLSWLPLLGVRMPISGPARTAIDLVDDVTEPVLRPLRGAIAPVRIGAVGLDLSVMILFVILLVLWTAFCQ
jgi:YggT family protein